MVRRISAARMITGATDLMSLVIYPTASAVISQAVLLMLVCRDEHLMWGLFLMCAVVQRMSSFLVINFLTQSPSEQGFLLLCAATSISNPRTGIALCFFSNALEGVTVELFVPALPTRVVSFCRRLLIGPAA